MGTMMVFAMSLIKAPSARPLSRDDAARAEQAFYARPGEQNRHLLARVAATLGGIALHAGSIAKMGS